MLMFVCIWEWFIASTNQDNGANMENHVVMINAFTVELFFLSSGSSYLFLYTLYEINKNTITQNK